MYELEERFSRIPSDIELEARGKLSYRLVELAQTFNWEGDLLALLQEALSVVSYFEKDLEGGSFDNRRHRSYPDHALDTLQALGQWGVDDNLTLIIALWHDFFDENSLVTPAALTEKMQELGYSNNYIEIVVACLQGFKELDSFYSMLGVQARKDLQQSLDILPSSEMEDIDPRQFKLFCQLGNEVTIDRPLDTTTPSHYLSLYQMLHALTDQESPWLTSFLKTPMNYARLYGLRLLLVLAAAHVANHRYPAQWEVSEKLARAMDVLKNLEPMFRCLDMQNIVMSMQEIIYQSFFPQLYQQIQELWNGDLKPIRDKSLDTYQEIWQGFCEVLAKQGFEIVDYDLFKSRVNQYLSQGQSGELLSPQEVCILPLDQKDLSSIVGKMVKKGQVYKEEDSSEPSEYQEKLKDLLVKQHDPLRFKLIVSQDSWPFFKKWIGHLMENTWYSQSQEVVIPLFPEDDLSTPINHFQTQAPDLKQEAVELLGRFGNQVAHLIFRTKSEILNLELHVLTIEQHLRNELGKDTSIQNDPIQEALAILQLHIIYKLNNTHSSLILAGYSEADLKRLYQENYRLFQEGVKELKQVRDMFLTLLQLRDSL